VGLYPVGLSCGTVARRPPLLTWDRRSDAGRLVSTARCVGAFYFALFHPCHKDYQGLPFRVTRLGRPAESDRRRHMDHTEISRE
jgi:hypothetical protein